MTKLGVRLCLTKLPHVGLFLSPRLSTAGLQDLHLFKGQCATSTLVAKVKLVERSFVGDATVEFQMYDAAPPPPAPQLPYFTHGEVVDSEENSIARYLAEKGAPQLIEGDGVALDALTTALGASAAVNKAVKAATKSKTAQVLPRLVLV